MKIKMLENEIERGGKIKNFTLRPGEKITFLEGATFKGNPVKAGTILYNNEELPKNLGLSPEGGLMLVPFKRPGTPHPGVYNGFTFDEGFDDGSEPKALTTSLLPSSPPSSLSPPPLVRSLRLTPEELQAFIDKNAAYPPELPNIDTTDESYSSIKLSGDDSSTTEA